MSPCGPLYADLTEISTAANLSGQLLKTMIKLFRKLPYKVSSRYEDGDLMMNARFSEPNE